MAMERCGPESRSRDSKGAGRKGSACFAMASQGEGENKAPCSPLSSLTPFSFGFTPERREGRAAARGAVIAPQQILGVTETQFCRK